MSRAIRFRAWDKQSDTFPNGGGPYYFNVGQVFGDVDIIDEFTGAHDKAGKEIFENDIVLCGANPWGNPGKKYLVEHIGHGFALTRPDAPGEHAWYGEPQTEVIGNRWQHPDLLS